MLRAAALLLILVRAGTLLAVGLPEGVTVDDLLSRTVIRSFSLSPDGTHVAFLTTEADCRRDVYRVRLFVQRTKPTGRPVLLEERLLSAEEVLDDISNLRSTAGQYVWSADSRRLLHTVHGGSGMALRIFNLTTGARQTVLRGHQHIEIQDIFPDQPAVAVKTFDRKPRKKVNGPPPDMALLIKDSYRFDLKFPNPRKDKPIVTESWSFRWQTERAIRIPNTKSVGYWPYPDEYSWNGHSIDVRYYGPLPDEDAGMHEPPANEKSKPDAPRVELEYQPTGTTVYVRKGKTARKVYRDTALLIEHYSENTDQTRQTYLSRDARTAVLLRSSNLVPDELVLLDLIDGKMSPLFSPNEKFRVKTRGITVQVIPIPVADGKMSGRLFLPADYHPGKRYPLVFTTYLSTPGFNLGSGEVPILPLVVHGIAVFALDAREVNVPGKKGDFVPELRRLQYPLAAMQWVADKLSGDGIVDLKRIGVTGLSYGTEIAMYAYFSSNLFRAVSATTGSQAPMLYSMGGLGWEEWLKDRGFSDPNEDLTKWRAFSAALNARASLPPLLWQAPDGERQWCVESWFDLRRAGAQVEWMEYPDEGHVKRGPANRWWVQERNLDWFRFWLMDEEDADPWKKLQYERWRHMRANWYAATVGTSYGAVVASPGKQDHQRLNNNNDDN